MTLRFVNDLVCFEVGKTFVSLFQLTVIAVLVTNPIAGHTVITASQMGFYLIGASICLLVGICLISYSKKLKQEEDAMKSHDRPLDVTVKKGVIHVLSSKVQDAK